MVLASWKPSQRYDADLMTAYQRLEQMPLPLLDSIAEAYFYGGLHDSAYVCYRIIEAKDESVEDNIASIGHAKTCIGILDFEIYNEYNKANTQLLEAENFAKQHNLSQEFPYIYLTMADVQFESNVLKDYKFSPEIFKSLQRAFDCAISHSDLYIASIAFNNLASAAVKYNMVQQFEPNIARYKQALVAYSNTPGKRDASPRDSMIMADYNIALADAMSHYYHGEYGEAVKAFDQMRGHILKKSQVSRANFEVCISLFKYNAHRKLNDNAAALADLDEIEAIATNDLLMLELLFERVKFCKQLGLNAKATQYELEYYKRKDTFLQQCNLMSTSQAELEYKLQQTLYEVNEQRMSKLALQKLIFWITLFAVALAVTLVILFFKNRDLREKNLNLYNRVQEMIADNNGNSTPEHDNKDAQRNNDPAVLAIMDKVNAVLQTSQEIFENGFSLHRLAQMVDASANDVSNAINRITGKNFNELLSDFRIKEACRRMNDQTSYGDMTIAAIADSVGIKSRSNFYTLFKKTTGLTPSAYLKIKREQA